MEDPHAVATVVRVPRYDTMQIRHWCPLTSGRLVTYCTPCGVFCDESAKSAIVDWCELHSDAERIGLRTFDYMRDDYGRLIVDLHDLSTGETLTSYLIQVGAAKPRPHHLLEALENLLHAGEVDDVCG